ncbi:minor capsid protein [Virgibacillus sp. CBA3643]|uniref:minor capsid protein n=1 Tax=Virgibacillus sp. CBA3643 TaxID=2942278 RepID=UPI0035A2C6CB
MALLDDVSKYIETNVTELVEVENLFKNYYPDDPDMVVSVIDLGGLPPNKYRPTREKKIEVKYRTKRYPEGIELGNQIFNLFHAFENYQMGDFYILASYADTEVSYLYEDSKNRKEFSIELVFMHKN